MQKPVQYPDISGIFERKSRGRRERASLSFSEKHAIVDKLREEASFIKRLPAVAPGAKAKPTS